ncbi:Tetratricopeptide repeat protein 21B, partial [Nowakowskiella sp. JEL0078]
MRKFEQQPMDEPLASSEEYMATINFYGQRKLFNHMLLACEKSLKRRVSDPVLLFWRGFAILMQGKQVEALREFESLQEKRDLVLAASRAMIYAHERCKMIDHEMISILQAKFDVASHSTTITERAIVQAAVFEWHTGAIESSRSMLKKLLELNPNSYIALNIMGYLDLQTPEIGKLNSWFDRVLEKNPRDLEALLGRVQYLRKSHKQLELALETASQII